MANEKVFRDLVARLWKSEPAEEYHANQPHTIDTELEPNIDLVQTQDLFSVNPTQRAITYVEIANQPVIYIGGLTKDEAGDIADLVKDITRPKRTMAHRGIRHPTDYEPDKRYLQDMDFVVYNKVTRQNIAKCTIPHLNDEQNMALLIMMPAELYRQFRWRAENIIDPLPGPAPAQTPTPAATPATPPPLPQSYLDRHNLSRLNPFRRH